MSIDPVHYAKSGKAGVYLKNTVLALIGTGTVAGVTGGYFNLRNQIAENNTQFTQKLDKSETARANMVIELSNANATIARLEQGMSANKATLEANATALDEYRKALAKADSDLKAQDTQITGLLKKEQEHDGKVTKLLKDLDSVTIKVGNLESKVSVSDLQDVYNKALASAVIIQMEVKHEEDDGMGGKVQKSHTHQGSGVVVAHINGGNGGGYIATNWHVVECDKIKEDDYKNMELTITLPDGSKVKAKAHLFKDANGKEQLARRKDHDLVLLKTTDKISGTSPVSFAPDEPKTGEAVIVVGCPFGDTLGIRFSGSFGIISGNSIVKYGNGSPEILSTDEKDAVKTARTDTAINPGNSGGLGWRVKDGKMVFMPTFIFPGDLFHGMGFGITAPTIRDDVKTWIPYDLNPDGSFVERAPKAAKITPVKADK